MRRATKTINCYRQTARHLRYTPGCTARHALKVTLALILVACTQLSNAASNELFGGPLGEWLRRDAQKQLTDLLSTHPRFRGERIRVVVMRDGLPATESNGLTQAIRSQLTHKLAQISNVQLVWGETLRGCQVPKKTPYLLGVEVARESRTRHLVRIAMVDVEEGVWVSGAHLQWRGLLTQAERQASLAVSVDGVAGTIDKPLAASNRAAVVEQLLASIQCSLQGGVDGSVYIAAADESDPLLAQLAVQLRKRVLHSAWLTVAENAAAADWQLRLVAAEDVGESVVATLSAQGSAEKDSVQRLAAVYIRRNAEGAESAGVQRKRLASAGHPRTPIQSGPTQPGPIKSSRTLPEPGDEFLGEIHPVALEPGDKCYSPAANCTEVQFEMANPGYVLVVRKSNNALTLSSCKAPVRSDGLKRYRFTAADAHRSDVSIYAVATADRKLASELHQRFLAAVTNCGERAGIRSDVWLANLDTLMNRVPGKIHWQALYRSPEILAQTTNPTASELR